MNIFTIDDKPYYINNEKCRKCDKETVWNPMFIGLYAPNRECASCGEIWEVHTSKNIEVKGGIDE